MLEYLKMTLVRIALAIIATLAIVALLIFAGICWLLEEPGKEITQKEFHDYD